MNSPGFGEVAEKMRRSTVRILNGGGRVESSGSGVVWTSDGMVITNAHVVRGGTVRAELWDGRSLNAEVLSRDPRTDLARLKLPAAHLPVLGVRPAASLREGELVIAVGNPLGFVGALTAGVMHVSGPVRGLGRQPWVQASIRLAPGNSGGPLADAEGRVIGINTMVMSGGLALAIPSETVESFIKRGSRPNLGVAVQTVSGARGVLVVEVAPNSAAGRASLLIGDLLIAANGRRLESVDDLGNALDEAAPGVLRLRFLRGDRLREREVSILLEGAREAA
jgi:serine protease Do